MKKIFTLILCFALICSLSVSSFAAGTPEPIYSNDSVVLSSDYDVPFPYCIFSDFDYVPSVDKTLYFLVDGSFYAFNPIIVEGIFHYGDLVALLRPDYPLTSLLMYIVDGYGVMFGYPCYSCEEESHTHSIAIYDEYPFASSAPASDAPAFIAATGDGFKMMNSITAGIMSNPVLLFLLAASLIPVGIALFKALKNAASRK